jgi:hypothetical protein
MGHPESGTRNEDAPKSGFSDALRLLQMAILLPPHTLKPSDGVNNAF